MQRFDPEHEPSSLAHQATQLKPGAPLEQGAPAAPAALWLRVLSRLPWSVLYALTATIVFIMRHALRFRVRVVRSNLRRCFPDSSPAAIESMLNAFYAHLGQVAAEFLKMATMSADEMRRRVHVTNAALVTAETDAGRSVLLLGTHLGNWEWALQGVTLASRVPIDAAYKPLHAAGADRELLKMRGRFGARLVAAKKILRVAARHRNEVHAIALMADQMPSSSASRQWLSFLGCDTAFYPGPAELGRMTGYATFYVAMRRIRRGYYEMSYQSVAAAGESVEPEIFTARYAQLLEAQIRVDPAVWMWAHRRWKLARPGASAVAGA
jgi:KDO2-lipid IV(A) lauroyltransferase